MRKSLKQIATVALLAMPATGYADSSYEHTTQVTGGQFINAIKSLPFAPKSLRALTEPTTESTFVHGNQKAIVSKDYTEIWDLDKEVIIHVDNQRKTYSVVTFADMRKMIAEMPAKMAQMQEQLKEAQAKQKQQPNQMPPNLKFAFSVDVKDTGVTRMIDQYNAKQQIMTQKTTVTDTNNPGTTIVYAFTEEIWTTQDLPKEMQDERDFNMRFGMKLMQGADVKDLMGTMTSMRTGGQAAMAQLFGGQPGADDAFVQMQKELAKITGTRLLEITRMGGSGTGFDGQNGAAGSGSGSNGNQGNANGNTSTTNVTSPSSMIGGALMGAWKKKKAQQDAAAQPASPAPAGTPGQPADTTLMEMTVSTHAFSSAPVGMGAFQVPPGFKQVESPMAQAMNSK